MSELAMAAPLLETGLVLKGTYSVVRRIGVGGMGEVYEARHVRLPRRFAVKVLSRQVDAGSLEFQRLRREAELASRLRHQHIVEIIDFDQREDGTPYIVMEYLEGHDLATELQRGRFPLPRALDVVQQIASAMGAVHGEGIVHRDLKPQNVFLCSTSGEGRDFVKVLDFGISKLTRTAAGITEERMLLGTPQYMAPEQAAGRPEEVDGRTDQFALAAMAYEMLAGKPPFNGDSTDVILYKVRNEPPPPLAGLVPGVSAELDSVLGKALAKTREDRFGSVGEMAAALARAGGGAARPHPAADAPTLTGAAPAGAQPTRRRPRSARRLLFAGLGALGFAAIFALVPDGDRIQPLPASAFVPAPGPVPAAVPHQTAQPPGPDPLARPLLSATVPPRRVEGAPRGRPPVKKKAKTPAGGTGPAGQGDAGVGAVSPKRAGFLQDLIPPEDRAVLDHPAAPITTKRSPYIVDL